jgi:galacturan 1,4-alpha-galacturonidase
MSWTVDQEKPPTGPILPLAAFAKKFSYENIKGSIAAVIGDASCLSDPCWYASLGSSSAVLLLGFTNLSTDESPKKGVYLLCADAAHCQDFHFDNIDLRTAVGWFVKFSSGG